MPNYFLTKVEQEVKRRTANYGMIHTQMCLDAAMIAANEVFNMGPSRAEAFAAAFSKALDEIATTTVQDTKDMEYTKARLDDALKRICGDSFQPWDERYKI